MEEAEVSGVIVDEKAPDRELSESVTVAAESLREICPKVERS
jgi:hypothetical protein